jgi:peptidoglycan/LPS O-acetylase OafA/YrhL
MKLKGLNSLRFFAFFAVFLFHALPGFSYGYLGVDFFFVLSSFLLTYLALNEIESKGRFSQTKFFVRRALRIFPLYFMVIVFSFFVLPYIGNCLGFQVSLPDEKWKYWLFLSNYETSDSVFALKFLWSIGVEEQFYFFFLLLSFLFKRYFKISLLILCCVYLAFIVYTQFNTVLLYSNTFSHFPNFILGMTGGYLYFKKHHSLGTNWLGIGLAIGALAFFEANFIFHIALSIFFLSLINITISICSNWENPLLRFFEKLGTYSYGLYVYSGFSLTFSNILLKENGYWAKTIVSLLLLLILSLLSYHFFEKRFLQLKKHYR